MQYILRIYGIKIVKSVKIYFHIITKHIIFTESSIAYDFPECFAYCLT